MYNRHAITKKSTIFKDIAILASQLFRVVKRIILLVVEILFKSYYFFFWKYKCVNFSNINYVNAYKIREILLHHIYLHRYNIIFVWNIMITKICGSIETQITMFFFRPINNKYNMMLYNWNRLQWFLHGWRSTDTNYQLLIKFVTTFNVLKTNQYENIAR